MATAGIAMARGCCCHMMQCLLAAAVLPAGQQTEVLLLLLQQLVLVLVLSVACCTALPRVCAGCCCRVCLVCTAGRCGGGKQQHVRASIDFSHLAEQQLRQSGCALQHVPQQLAHARV